MREYVKSRHQPAGFNPIQKGAWVAPFFEVAGAAAGGLGDGWIGEEPGQRGGDTVRRERPWC